MFLSIFICSFQLVDTADSTQFEDFLIKLNFFSQIYVTFLETDILGRRCKYFFFSDSISPNKEINSQIKMSILGQVNPVLGFISPKQSADQTQ